MPAMTSQVAPAQEAGRPQPQTTIEPPGGPFIRHSQSGRRPQYVVSGQAYGSLITQPLVAAPGYARKFRLRFAATGGSTSATVSAAADSPFNVASLVTLRDAFGTPLIVGPGWEIFKALPKYGGQFGLHALSDPVNLPSFSNVQTASGPSSGNFNFQTVLPLEFAKAYGVISMANASLLPSLQIQLASNATVIASAGVAPVIGTLEVE